MRLNDILLFIVFQFYGILTLHAQENKLIILSELGVITQNQDGSHKDIIYNFKSNNSINTPLTKSQKKYFGTITKGGQFGLGAIYSMNFDGSNFAIHHTFKNHNYGVFPEGNLLEIDNQFYGITKQGGKYNNGILYKIDKKDFNLEVVYHFSSCQPNNGITLGTDKYIWGTTTNQQNLIYKVKIDGNDFNSFPLSKLASTSLKNIGFTIYNLAHINDYLWGITYCNNNNERSGIVYRIKNDGTNLQTVHILKEIDGFDNTYYSSQLIEHDGYLWGILTKGGKYNNGTLFKINTTSLAYDVVHHFSSNTLNPVGEIKIKNNKVFGVSKNNTLYEFDINSNHFISLQIFKEDINPFFNIIDDTFTFTSTDKTTNNLSSHIFNSNDFQLSSSIIYNNPFYTNDKHNLDIHVVKDDVYLISSKGGTHNYGNIQKFELDGSNFKTIFNFTHNHSKRSKLVYNDAAFWGISYLSNHTSKPNLFKINIEKGEYNKVSEVTIPDSIPPHYYDQNISIIDNKIWSTVYNHIISYNIIDSSYCYNIIPESLISSNSKFKKYNGEVIAFINHFNDKSSILKLDSSLTKTDILFKFSEQNESINGNQLNLPFVIKNNFIYGSTTVKGNNGNGTYFSFNLMNNQFQKLGDFSENNSTSGIIDAGKNKLWGIFDEQEWGNASFFNFDTEGKNFTHTFSCCGEEYGTLIPQYKIIKLLFSRKIYPTISFNKLFTIQYGDLLTIHSDIKSDIKITSSNDTIFKVNEDNSISIIDVGKATIKVELAETDSSFAINRTYNLISSQADLIVYVDSLESVYGKEIPQLSYTLEGLLYNDQEEVLQQKINITTEAFQYSNAGRYLITGTDFHDEKYNVNFINSHLKIKKENLEFTVHDTIKTYGDITPKFNYTINGFVASQDTNDLDSLPYFKVIDQYAPSGFHNIILEGGYDKNYNYDFEDGRLSIQKAILSVTAQNESRSFGDENPIFKMDIQGFKGDDTKDSIASLPYVFSNATSESSIGEYPIIVNDGEDTNYNFEYNNGLLSVIKKKIKISVDSVSKVYGEENPTFTFSITDSVNEAISSEGLASNITVSTLASDSSDVGYYDIIIHDIEDENYEIEYTNGVLQVSKAKAILHLIDQEITYGEALPSFTYTILGLKLDEDTSQFQIDITTDATLSSDAGAYNISGSFFLNNYDTEVIDAKLTINKADQKITNFNPPETIQISDGILNLIAVATSGLEVEFDCDKEHLLQIEGNIGNLLDIGEVKIKAKQNGNINYNSASIIESTIEITPSLLTSFTIEKANFNIYPNPSYNYFSIETPVEKLLFFDTNGTLIKKFNAKKINQPFNISDLSSGIYLILIKVKGEKKYKFCKLSKL